MKYELNRLDIIINSTEFNPSQIEEILVEQKRIIIAWRATACIGTEQTAPKNYYKQHQLGLLSIVDKFKLAAFQPNDILKLLESILIKLIDDFYEYLDWSVVVPHFLLQQTKASLQAELKTIKEFTERQKTSELLVRLADVVSDWVYTNQSGAPTYEVNEMQLFQKALNPLNTNSRSLIESDKNLTNLLCHINFNEPGIFQVLKQTIRSRASEIENTNKRLQFLNDQCTHFKHIPVKPYCFYAVENRLLARSLFDFANKLQVELENDINKSFQIEMFDNEENTCAKLMTSLTIEELSLFNRLSVETGVIKIKKNGISALARYMSAQVRTLTKGVYDEFKPDTFYKYYFSINQPTTQSVISILKRMLRKAEDLHHTTTMQNKK